MSQSLSLVIVHVIFSTKDRERWITPSMRPRLHAYLAETARGLGCMAYRVGGVSDHVHLALTLPRTLMQCDLIKELKTSCTRWLHKQDRELAGFSWQRGYGIFSIGKSQLPALITYVDGQEEHHRTRSFQDEFRTLLRKYGVEFDEAYVWD